MLTKLSNDLKMIIYSYLDFKFICKFEKDRDLLEFIINIQNPSKPKKTLFNNYILNKCYKCFEPLKENYVISICYYCQYNINEDKVYSSFCTKCVELSETRSVKVSNCKICDSCTVFIGIEPYS